MLRGQVALKYLFFDFKTDSSKVSNISISSPANFSSLAISNSVLVDYFKNNRLQIVCGLATNSTDTQWKYNSLFTGNGNITADLECPIAARSINSNNLLDFIGFSINPRISAQVQNNAVMQPGTLNFDVGLNSTGAITGDLGAIKLRCTLRNALSSMQQPVQTEDLTAHQKYRYFYSAAQVNLRSGTSMVSVNIPFFAAGINQSKPKLPIFAGYSLLF